MRWRKVRVMICFAGSTQGLSTSEVCILAAFLTGAIKSGI